MEVLKVSAKSNPNSVAGALAGVIREKRCAEIQAIGAGAINQAVKAIAIARGFIAPTGVDFLPPIGTENRLEGYLFPDTYHIGRSASAKEIITIMLSRFAQVIDNIPPSKTDLSFEDIVILASIVEKEAVAVHERPIIASAFLNRLSTNQRLESCATLQYALPEHKERLLLSDLEFKSPYNTYRNDGLPPGPICNPGKEAIIAVLQPAETDYKYFVAKNDGSGEHLFAETYAGHLANRRKLGY